jgi:hypothetical protein
LPWEWPDRCYGSTDVLNFEDIEKPTSRDDEALVKVHARGKIVVAVE